MRKKLYLASPYSDPDPKVREERCRAVQKEAAKLMEQGYAVFSPIAHSHGIAAYLGNKNSAFWMEQDLPFLQFCDEMAVLCLPNWENSKGIKTEIEYAKSLGIPIRFLPA